jgi:hypothetical protein
MKAIAGYAASPQTSSLTAMQDGLTVRQIMTPRDALLCCAPEDRLREVTGNNPERYSFVPVRKDNRFLGLLRAEKWFDSDAPDDAVDDHYTHLGESELIGADASIADFVLRVAEQPCRLVVAGTRIEGMVSISDLQQLPVRAALFGLVTGLELAMADVIRAHFDDEETWLSCLNENRQEKIKAQIKDSVSHDGFVDALLFTQFADKKALLRDPATKLFGKSKNLYDREMKSIQNLRDALAHANEYAATPEHGREVARTVASIFDWHKALSNMKFPEIADANVQGLEL